MDELRGKQPRFSNPSNVNPNMDPSKNKEEGELSSSDDTERPFHSAVQSAGTVAPPAGPTSGSLTEKNTPGIQAGRAISGNNLASYIQSRTSIQPNNEKSVEKNRVPFKSANSGWFAPSGANNNLVISFSDDDSGSEFEDNGQEKALHIKSNTNGMDGNRRRPNSSLGKSNNLRQTATNVNKVIPKKSSLSHINVPSMTKVRGGVNSKGAEPLSMEQGSRVRNFNTLNKNLASQERGRDQGVGLNNSKLQDLRQQIALRESELKLKAAQQNRESVSFSCRDHNAMNLSNDAAMKCKSTSADVGQLEPKEPDKKRLKVSGSYSVQLTLDGRKESLTAKSILPSNESVLENSNLWDRNKVDRDHKIIPTSRTGSSTVKCQKQDDRRADVSPENTHRVVKDGADFNTSCNQSDRSTRRVDPCVVLNQTESVANMTASNLPRSLISMELNHPSKIGGHHAPNSFVNEVTREHNLMKSSDYQKFISGDRTLEPSFNNMCQASLNNASFWNCLGNVNVSGHSNMDVRAVVEMEESLDKELEEVQEHRRMCEIEERNALKAYRKAQRALVEANARCTDLYRKRELCSAHFRSLIMNDSRLLWSSGRHEHVGIGLDSSNNINEKVDLIPMSSHQMQPDYDGINRRGYDSNLQLVNGAHLITSYPHVNGQNLGSEPCSERDASTSEPLPHISKIAANGVSSPSNDPNISADEDEETFPPMDHESSQPNFKYQQKDQNSEGQQKDPNNEANKKFSIDGNRDSLLLEETLRSELFARLGKRTLLKTSNSCHNVGPAVEQGAEDDGGSDKTQMSNGSVPFSEAEKTQRYDLGGIDRPERSSSEAPVHIQNQCHVENSSLEIHSLADFEVGGFPTRDHLSTTSVILPPLILRSTFSHMKVKSPITSLELPTRNQQNHAYVGYGDWRACVNSDEIQWSNLIVNSMQATVRYPCGGEMGSYTCNDAVDPFWPLCMYELRGKCNNDECPWQHVKNISNGNTYKHQQDDSHSADCQVGLAVRQQNCNGTTKVFKYHDVLNPPTYLVGLDILKADPHSYGSLVAQKSGQCWRKCFSTTLALSTLFQKDLPTDEPFLHGSDGRIEVHGSWSRQSSYFQSRNGIVNQLKQAGVNNTQFLETALLILNQEVNKVEGMKKALSVLSRALEADPTAEILWIVYLLIYYSHTKSVGKDDMFSFAVKQNERSYGLWLMCINSRIHLDDRLVAYDAALSALCCHTSVSDRDEMHASACILDLFLQMIDCLCMSGNVEKAIQRIYELFPGATSSDEPHSRLLSDILTCLTISDKHIFWVCCVYLVIYRKLPDALVKRFECEKELLDIEWPSVHLVDDEKKRAIKLVEMAVDSVQSCINRSEIDLKLAQHFALCHIRCMVALDGLGCCRNLLDKYIKLFPSCLELILISARGQKHDSEDLSFVGFEEALSNWPKEVPGIECIWNQYAEYALQNGRPDFAKELLVRWFHSVWKVKYPQNEILDAMDGDSSHGSLKLASTSSVDHSVSNLSRMDLMFGFLNLSLHKLLQNDHIEARLAINRALKAAAAENFKHCVREHAMFLLTDESLLKGEASLSRQLNILNGYLNDASAFPVSEPLSRHFMNNTIKPRVRQLISNILSPVSFDFSLVNLVLEVWYGAFLLPPKANKLKDLVDFVEAILDIVPSNYQIAFSVCKLLSRDYNSGDVTSASVFFWASSTMVNAIFNAIPIAPEYAWVEAANILGNITGMEAISERFFKRALSIYPFSIKLWKCYHNLSKTTENTGTVVEAARKKGIELE